MNTTPPVCSCHPGSRLDNCALHSQTLPAPLDLRPLDDAMDMVQIDRDQLRHAVAEALACMDLGLYRSARVELERVVRPLNQKQGPT